MLSACGSMGFPHVGTVDTRHHAPGTLSAQASAGGGVGALGPPGAFAAGAALSLDTHVAPQVSVATSAHLLLGYAYEDELTGSARVGLRYRPTQKLSLGFGGFGGYSATPSLGDTHAWNYGGDLELATSYPRSKDHFVSHAWRISLGRSTRNEMTGTLLGDWSRSIPIKNKELRFSFGVNYGFTYIKDIVGVIRRPDPNSIFDSNKQKKETGPAFILGAHAGVLWGRNAKRK